MPAITDPCAGSRNNERVCINRAPCNCANMITLLGVRGLLGFVTAWRSDSDLFNDYNFVSVCGVGGVAINRCKTSKVVLIISCSF